MKQKWRNRLNSKMKMKPVFDKNETQVKDVSIFQPTFDLL